jgi:hypothetical protein
LHLLPARPEPVAIGGVERAQLELVVPLLALAQLGLGLAAALLYAGATRRG